MNRSILIVICDFLLVSLLAFSTADINKATDNAREPLAKSEVQTNRVDSGSDLAAVMRLALEEERKGNEKLQGELALSRQTAGQQQVLLAQRETQVKTFQQQLEVKEQESAKLLQQQTNLETQFARASTNVDTLTRQLETETTISKEKLAAMEAELRKRAEEAASLQQRMTALGRSNQLAGEQVQHLEGQLQVARVEQRASAEMAARMQEEVKVEREEKAKLAEGFKTLATNSVALAQEVRENRALAPNTIFNQFLTNRVEAQFAAVRSGLFGVTRRRETQTILVSDGTNAFALCHVQDTPLTLWNPGPEWDGITGELVRGTTQIPIQSLSFYLRDPRVVMSSVSAEDVQKLGCKVYRISSDPYKFQDAVLVGAKEGYYGECRFQIDPGTPDYVKLDNSFLKGLFGKFNPSRGDLVFSKTGELLGVMANDTYCMMIHGFDAAATVRFGQDVRDQHTTTLLSQLYSIVNEMPFRLQ